MHFGGHAFATRKKWRDVLANPRFTFVVDDLARSELPYGPLAARRCLDAERCSSTRLRLRRPEADLLRLPYELLTGGKPRLI
jgi:hypothetical protein